MGESAVRELHRFFVLFQQAVLDGAMLREQPLQGLIPQSILSSIRQRGEDLARSNTTWKHHEHEAPLKEALAPLLLLGDRQEVTCSLHLRPVVFERIVETGWDRSSTPLDTISHP